MDTSIEMKLSKGWIQISFEKDLFFELVYFNFYRKVKFNHSHF